MPKKPKLIFQICQKLSRGLFMVVLSLRRHSSCDENRGRASRHCNAQNVLVDSGVHDYSERISQRRSTLEPCRSNVELSGYRSRIVVYDDDNRLARGHSRISVLLAGNIKVEQRTAPQGFVLGAKTGERSQMLECRFFSGSAIFFLESAT